MSPFLCCHSYLKVLMCIFLRTNDVKHYFMCFLAICMSSVDICLVKSFIHFKVGLSYCFSVVGVVYEFWVLIPYQMWFANIFSSSVGSLFTLLVISFVT